MKLKQIYRISIAVILISAALVSLIFVGVFIKRTVQHVPIHEQQQNSVLLWNMADEPIRVTFRPRKYYGDESISLAPGMRGCFQVESISAQEAPIKQLTVYYKKARYRFTDRELLNTYFETSDKAPVAKAKNDAQMKPCLKKGIRYFAIAVIGYGQEEWPRLQSVLGDKIREKGQYLVLSNYAKLSQPFDESAVLQVMRL
jgi:hypothetical protein